MRPLRPALLAAAATLALAGTALSGQAASAADLEVIEAPAVDSERFYLTSRAGIADVRDTSFLVGALNIERVKNEYGDLTPFTSVAAGTTLGSFRAELELSNIMQGVDRHIAISPAGIATPFSSGETLGVLAATAVTANLYYEMDMDLFRPFVGAGLGVGRVQAHEYGVTPLRGVLPGGIALDDTAYGVAYQLTAGIAFDVAQNFTVELGYRFQGIHQDLFSVTNAKSHFDIRSHTGFAGVRAYF